MVESKSQLIMASHHQISHLPMHKVLLDVHRVCRWILSIFAAAFLIVELRCFRTIITDGRLRRLCSWVALLIIYCTVALNLRHHPRESAMICRLLLMFRLSLWRTFNWTALLFCFNTIHVKHSILIVPGQLHRCICSVILDLHFLIFSSFVCHLVIS